MLDKQTAKLLRYLARICDDGSYKIIETAEVTKAVSQKAEIETVRPMLKFLQDNDMIDIKYSDESKFSLSVLPKGRVFVETQSNKKINGTLSRRMIILLIAGTLVAAFVGALLGGIIANSIG
jgi:hypothetical protein